MCLNVCGCKMNTHIHICISAPGAAFSCARIIVKMTRNIAPRGQNFNKFENIRGACVGAGGDA